MDDEPGATTDPYCRIRLGDTVKKTRFHHKILDPVWNEKFILKTPLHTGEKTTDDHLILDVMDFDQSAHDLVGSCMIRIGPKQNPFPDQGTAVAVPRVSMAGTSTTTTIEGWYNLIDKEGEPVYGVGGRKVASVRVTAHHRHEVRDLSFRPTPAFLSAAEQLPGTRSRRQVLSMAREMVRTMPAVVLLSSKFVAMLCEVGELKRWRCRDVVELQNKSAATDSLHFVLSGRFTLHSQRTGPHMNMYKVLKSRSFGTSTSFGPTLGWRGAGEAFGEGAVVLEEGLSSTSVCMSEEGGLTLRVDRRDCERVMEQFRRREAGYSRSLHGRILASDPAHRDITTLSAYLKGSPCVMLHRISDESVAAIAACGRLTRVEGGTVVDPAEHGDCVHILCCGTLAVLRDARSPAIAHSLPVPGECVDVLGPGATFGVRGGGARVLLLAREGTDLLSLPRGTLEAALRKDEAFRRLVASPEASSTSGAEQEQATPTGLMKRSGSTLARSQSFKKVVKPVKTQVNFVMAVFQRLRALSGLDGVGDDALWLLAQAGKLTECVPGLATVRGGAAVVLKGEAELKAFSAAEKPADDGGLRRVIAEGDTVVGGTEIVCSGRVSLLVWQQAEWDYATGTASSQDGDCLLAVGEESVPSSTVAEIVAALHGVPILREVPTKMLTEIAPHVRAVRYPDGAIPLSDGEHDCSLYVVHSGSVAVYQDRELEEANTTSQLAGCDVIFHASFGPRTTTLAPGDAFQQVEFVTGARSCLTAVCRGTTELLVLPRECLSAEIQCVVALSIERSPPTPAGASHLGSEGEMHVLRMLHDLEGHSLRTQLSWKATTFLCGHMRRLTLQPGDQHPVRDAQTSFVLAMLSGKLRVRPVTLRDDKDTPAVAMLRSGDVFDGHHGKAAEELLGASDVRLVAVAKEESSLFVIDSHFFRTAHRKTLIDTVATVRTFLMRIPLFTSLPLFLFDRLSRLAKFRKLVRDDRVYSSEDASETHVKFLTSGEFKVTKKLAHNTPLATLGPGCCFGVLDRDRQQQGEGQMHFAVFASSEGTVIELQAKELLHLLASEVVDKLQEQLDSDALLADRSASHDVSSMFTRQHAKTALASRRVMRQRSASLSDLSQDEDSLEGYPPPRLPKDTGPMSKILYQTTLTSGGMTTFFENVANGKITGMHDAQSRAPVGKPPEEVLPSLRPKFLADKIAQIQRKAQMDGLRPLELDKILSPRAMSRRDARKKGLRVLQLFQSKVELLRKDANQRTSHQTKADEYRRLRAEAQALNDLVARNKDVVGSQQSHRQELEDKAELLEAAMQRQRETNEQREQERAERAAQAVSRKEVNEQHHLERVQTLRRQSAILKRKVAWLMMAALGQRMAAWHRTFAYVRSVRQDFGLWVAAAISIQRRFRKHVYGVVRKRKAEAVALIVKNFRIGSIMLRIEKKKRGVPIIATFLKEYLAQAQGFTFHFQRFRINVKRVQRFWRLSSQYLSIIHAVVAKSWDQVELRVRKEEAERLRAEEMQGRGKGRAPPPTKKLDVAVPALPYIIKMPQIWKLTRETRRAHTELKTRWRSDFRDWIKREDYRVLIQRERSMLQGHGDVERDSMLDEWLDDDDPPPRCPMLNPVPPVEVLDKVIRDVYTSQAKAAAEAKARGKARTTPMVGTRKRLGRN